MRFHIAVTQHALGNPRKANEVARPVLVGRLRTEMPLIHTQK
jgi:hypothetical protein